MAALSWQRPPHQSASTAFKVSDFWDGPFQDGPPELSLIFELARYAAHNGVKGIKNVKFHRLMAIRDSIHWVLNLGLSYCDRASSAELLVI